MLCGANDVESNIGWNVVASTWWGNNVKHTGNDDERRGVILCKNVEVERGDEKSPAMDEKYGAIDCCVVISDDGDDDDDDVDELVRVK